MKKNPDSQSGIFNPRILVALTLCSVGVLLAMLSFAATPPSGMKASSATAPLAPTGPGWSIVTPGNPTGRTLYDVTCASASDCWAVGSNGPSLIEHWNGNAWSIVPSPDGNPGSSNVLKSVVCASASECWAVGNYLHYYNSTGVAHTLIEKWDGTSWTIVTSPENGPLDNSFSSVTCASASDCWAVGSFTYSDNGFPLPTYQTQALIEHWDGAAWTNVSSPNASGTSLVAVTCASSADCWAIGSWGVIDHWDGNSWTVAVPPTADIYIYLQDVTCASSSDCWAVGYYNNEYNGGEEYAYELIEHWDGTRWAYFPSPDAGSLVSVTCLSASDCWALGPQHWDGTSWSVVPSPSPSGSQFYFLRGMTCASTSECWAVGEIDGGSPQTLIEEYAPTIPPLTNIVSRKIHGSAGTFDVDLLSASPAIECRSPGATGINGVDYKIVFSFVNNVTNCGSASTGFLSSGPNSNQCTVNLTGVTNEEYLTVTLNNVLDSQTNTGNVAATMGVLLGDTTGNGSVNASDISQTKAQSGTAATATNFRTDVTVSGLINSSDISTVKSKSGTALP